MSDPLRQTGVSRQTSTTAIVSLVSGLLGWTLLPLIGSLVAIVTGHIARAGIRRNPETTEGDGLAIAGLLLGYAAVAIAVASVIALIVFFGGLAALIALASHWS